MKLSPILKKIQHAFTHLHPTDICLLIFMVLLMMQSAHNLFFPVSLAQGDDSFGIIVRTTAAAIFGYFISANFQNGGHETAADPSAQVFTTTAASSLSNDHPTAKIGFSMDQDRTSMQLGATKQLDDPPVKPQDHLQILIVASIGILSLVLLIIAHNHFYTTTISVATVSQLRDFVSGSVGFLIGHSTHTDSSR